MNKRARGYLITIFASIAWGFSGVCSEFLMKEYHADPYWLTAIRMLLAAPTFPWSSIPSSGLQPAS